MGPVLSITPALIAAACLLLTGPPAAAQEAGARERRPPESQGDPAPRTAVPREAPAPSPPQAAPPAPMPRTAVPATAGDAAPPTQSGAQPRSGGRREAPAQPRVAVPRGSAPGQPTIVLPPRIIVGGYPRGAYPYGYGGFGLGYFYYDPYGWYGPARVAGYGGPTGQIRLRVQPREAEVYVDGYYAGVVDDFDGMFQGLRLEEGPYAIEIVAPGYEPLEVRVRIQPGRRMTYRGELTPIE